MTGIRAQAVPEVVALMRDYIATLTPEEIATLPASVWDALNVDDISGSAVVLIREELNLVGKSDAADLLHEIAHTFVAASTRLASIQARGQPFTSQD